MKSFGFVPPKKDQ